MLRALSSSWFRRICWPSLWFTLTGNLYSHLTHKLMSSSNTIDIAVEAMDEFDREKYLLNWTTERCGEDGVTFTFDEGWDMIKRFGLDVLSDMLKHFLRNDEGSDRKER